MGSQDLYLTHRAQIEKAIAVVCRRHSLSSADAEDFASVVRLHLLDADCAVLRRFEGRSSLTTFLVAVVAHQFLDWRNAQWGKWRPSREARRLGPVAMLLEQLVVRDQLSFDEALETLRTNHRVTESRAALEHMATRFPGRTGRRQVTSEILEGMADPRSNPDAEIEQAEAEGEAGPIRQALRDALAALPAQDQLIVRLRFVDGVALVDIAKTLGFDAKPLYRRVERLMQQLRSCLHAAGVDAEAIRELLDTGVFDKPLALEGGRHPVMAGDRGSRSKGRLT